MFMGMPFFIHISPARSPRVLCLPFGCTFIYFDEHMFMCIMRKNLCGNMRENALSGMRAEITGEGYIILAALLVFAFAFLPLLLRQVA